jgi:hypothetical protein
MKRVKPEIIIKIQSLFIIGTGFKLITKNKVV